MTVTVANLPYSFCPNSSSQSNQGFMFKNAYDAFFYSNATATSTQITDTDYPGTHSYTLSTLTDNITVGLVLQTYTVTSLTSVTTTATATTSINHNIAIGDTVLMTTGYTNYAGAVVVTGTPAANQFTYTLVVPTGGLPATGNITAQGGKTTTATSAVAHGFIVGNSVTISGATPAAFNGTFVIATVPTSSTFTYTAIGTTSYSITGPVVLTGTKVATATTSATHGFGIGESVIISGATPAAYNGTYTINSVPDSTHFTYSFAGGTSPATGTITAAGGRRTVPGIVFMDGYFVVMDTNARIQNSNLNDALAWNALDFIVAQIEPGSGVAIAKSQNYIIALKEWSCEFFYDAGNAVGSPFSTVGNGFNLVGCASGDSVTNLDGILFWVSQTRQKGRGVHMMQGLQEQSISTPDIERVLNLSTLATVYSYGVKIAGHSFYILTLVDRNITLVFDMTSKTWAQWSSLTAGTPVSVTSITLSGTTATVTCGAAHNLLDGDPVNIAGAVQGAYNGIFPVSYVSSTVFTIETTAGTTTPATGTITSTPYTETYFKYTKYVNALGRDLVQHETNGTLCELTDAAYADVGNPVNVMVRTDKLDGGNTNFKSFSRLEIIGNKVDGTAYARYSGDDYVTNSKYRPINLNQDRSAINRLGSDRRRSFELKYLGSTSLQLAAIDIDVV